MSNPLLVSLPANTWVAVALAVKVGVVWPENRENAPVWFTYRMAGDPPPALPFDGTEKPLTSDYAIISNDVPIDVYIIRQDSDGVCTVCL